MAKILSIEIGNSVTKICEMDYKVKNPKVYKYFSFPTPAGVLEDGFVHENPEFVIALKSGLHDNKIKTKSAIFSVTSTKIVTREVTVPNLKPAQLATFIKSNANDYFPIDLSMYEVAYVALGTDTTDESGSKQRVMVMAAGKDLISGYIQLASVCGLKLNCLDYSGNSVYQLLKGECESDLTTLVVRIEENSTIASVISNGNLMLQRTLAYGTERVVKSVIDSTEYYESDYGPAFRLLCQKPVLKVTLSDRTRILDRDEAQFESDTNEEARTRVTSTLTQLVGNLMRIIELYNSKDPMNPIRKVVLTGIGAEMVNIPKLFHNELGITTATLDGIKSLEVIKTGDENLGRYIGVIGAGIAPVGLMTNDVKNHEKKPVNYGLYTIIALIVVVIALGGLFLKSYLPYSEAQKEEERLKDLEASYQVAEVVHKQYVAIESMYTEVQDKFALTENSNDAVIEFLNELEKKLPADTNLETIASNNDTVTLVIHIADYNEGGKILQILRGFDSLRTVTIAGMEAGEPKSEPAEEDQNKSKEPENEGEETTEENPGFEMTVTCGYYPNGATKVD